MPSILVVDDQVDTREMLRAFLSSCGFLVHTATDGLDAITVAQRVLPSVILMDVMMPRMDGFEATRRLKADTRTRAIPVIAFTNLGQAARSAGCEDLLLKPRDLDRLAEELHKRRHFESADTRAINTGLSVEEAIAADMARDDAIAAAIEGRDRRTDPTTLQATDPRAPRRPHPAD